MLSVQAIIMEHPQRSLLAKHWELNPDCVFLNHGSFGATPTHIRNEQRGWMNLLEEEPVRFFEDLAEGFMKNSRLALAKMLHCDAGDLALIENATSGVNTILRSLVFNEGDEILVPDHAYQACRNTIDFVAERLLKLDIKICLSSADIFDSAVLPEIPAPDKIEIT